MFSVVFSKVLQATIKKMKNTLKLLHCTLVCYIHGEKAEKIVFHIEFSNIICS